ncbi:carbonic anhydrase [Aquabacterium sp.]|jgi:carbonic anhydrase|uniref:carbonic anhydrase n=1 Tax=Aquabacterium sp. TaxID=1872578 RepID=UPI0025C275E8|nr:carbonic anhydrase family protein [Aquabacterium sp.]
MRPTRIFALLLSTLTLAGASAFAAQAEPAPQAPHAPHVHWGYSGAHGPAHWAAVDEGFSACSAGHEQSPINISTQALPHAGLGDIRFDYQTSPLNIVDNGHTIQVNYAPGSHIEVGGHRYELVQFHFHKPSEERVNGKAYAMVAHLVHKDAEGHLAVVAVLLDKGQAKPLLQAIFDNLPQHQGEPTAVPGVAIDLNALLPEHKGYYHFAGSLTTPPCSEGVNWFVLKEPAQASAAQIARFGRAYAHNARPVQPLNGRTVEVSE